MDSKQRKILGITGISVICLFVFCLLLVGCAINKTESTQPTVQYEKDNTTDHTHSWDKVENVEDALLETTLLKSFACKGIERVYVVRYRYSLYNPVTDHYTACDENFKDIEISARDSNIVIEYISEGTPRLEKYKDPQVFCSECGARLVHEGYTYKFCIPEGTYLVRFE